MIANATSVLTGAPRLRVAFTPPIPPATLPPCAPPNLVSRLRLIIGVCLYRFTHKACYYASVFIRAFILSFIHRSYINNYAKWLGALPVFTVFPPGWASSDPLGPTGEKCSTHEKGSAPGGYADCSPSPGGSPQPRESQNHNTKLDFLSARFLG